MSRPHLGNSLALTVALAALAVGPSAHANWLDEMADKAKAAAKKLEHVDLRKEADEAARKLRAVDLKAKADEAARRLHELDLKARVDALAQKLSAIPAAQAVLHKIADRGPQAMTGFLGELAQRLELAQLLVTSAKDYRVKLSELRALRQRPAPIATGYNPQRALSRGGLASLELKAAVYERETEARHVHSGVLFKETAVDPKTRALSSAAALGDSAYHNGQYLAARAYKFGVTGAASDLARLENSLLGAYHQMTLASAPGGRILDPRTGQVVTPRAGLPIRGFADDASPYFASNPDLDPKRHDTYVYEGTLAGLPGKHYRFMADVSRDQLAGLLLGFQAAHEVLTRRNASAQWRERIGVVVGTFAREFVKNGLRIVDLTGRPTEHGDGSNMKDPVTLMFNLSWLKIAAEVTGAADLRGAYDQLVRAQLGPYGVKGLGMSAVLSAAVGPLLQSHPEVVRYVVSDFNYNLLGLTIHPLLHLERNPVLRSIYLTFLNRLMWPLMNDLRVPFFDAVYMIGNGQKSPALVGRIAGVLGQYRADLTPFANYVNPQEYVTDFSQRADLRDPLHDYLHNLWETDLKHKAKGAKDNPIKSGGGTWPLGPGLVSADNNIERASPYKLRGTGWQCGANVCEYAGHDYLLSYWYARYHGIF